jgi:hypothetical protein
LTVADVLHLLSQNKNHYKLSPAAKKAPKAPKKKVVKAKKPKVVKAKVTILLYFDPTFTSQSLCYKLRALTSLISGRIQKAQVG